MTFQKPPRRTPAEKKETKIGLGVIGSLFKLTPGQSATLLTSLASLRMLTAEGRERVVNGIVTIIMHEMVTSSQSVRDLFPAKKVLDFKTKPPIDPCPTRWISGECTCLGLPHKL